MRIDVRPSGSRFVTRTDWVESRHSFSYGPHYDPANVGFGLLVAHNDDLLQPGGGFAEHSHRDVDIVTWVVRGAIAHTDDAGNAGTVGVGQVQRLSTGSGVRHSEVNASDVAARYLQMWISTDVDGPPDYGLAQAGPGQGEFALIASGREPAPLVLRQSQASLLAARLAPGESAHLPDAAFVHVFVVAGAVMVGHLPLAGGDAARVSDATRLTVSGADAASSAAQPAQQARPARPAQQAEVLAWVMDGPAWRPAP